MILAGDIGGTKTLIGLFSMDAGGLRSLRQQRYASQEHASLEEILESFLAEDPPPSVRCACFGVAGPVLDGAVRATNLPWQVEERVLSELLRTPRVRILNDLEATAYGTLFLEPEQRVALSSGPPPMRQGNIAVIAAGTGLGQAMLHWDGERHHPLASEGGHADFAPQTAQQIRLLEYLQAQRGGHISYERVLSGPGLVDIYRFLREESAAPEPEWLGRELAGADASAAVTTAGLEQRDPVCGETLDLFVSLYGAEAGNMALRCLARGGVVVGGGIAPRILPALRAGAFMRAFLDKGRFRPLLEGIPVSVCTEPRVALCGSAQYAQTL